MVVTHHGPSIKSVPEMYLNDVTTAAYVSNLEDLEDLIERYKPNYWMHGHLHSNSDYMVEFFATLKDILIALILAIDLTFV